MSPPPPSPRELKFIADQHRRQHRPRNLEQCGRRVVPGNQLGAWCGPHRHLRALHGLRVGDRRRRRWAFDDSGAALGVADQRRSCGEREPAAVLFQDVIDTAGNPGPLGLVTEGSTLCHCRSVAAAAHRSSGFREDRSVDRCTAKALFAVQAEPSRRTRSPTPGIKVISATLDVRASIFIGNTQRRSRAPGAPASA